MTIFILADKNVALHEYKAVGSIQHTGRDEAQIERVTDSQNNEQKKLVRHSNSQFKTEDLGVSRMADSFLPTNCLTIIWCCSNTDASFVEENSPPYAKRRIPFWKLSSINRREYAASIASNPRILRRFYGKWGKCL